MTRADGHLRIANPIYQEVIPRALAAITQATIPYETQWYVADNGTLDMGALVEGFIEFWCEHSEVLLDNQPYHEAAPHLVWMAFLQRIVNGGGFIDREYAVGLGRLDLCIRWPHGDEDARDVQRIAMELKVWRSGRPDPLERGLTQLSGYLERLGLDTGWLVVFDQRDEAAAISERVARDEREHEGRRIRVLRL